MEDCLERDWHTVAILDHLEVPGHQDHRLSTDSILFATELQWRWAEYEESSWTDHLRRNSIANW